MKSFFFFAALLLAPLAHAQSDDQAIPYSDDGNDDDRNRRELPSKSDSTPTVCEETEVEERERAESLAHIDDPSIGIGAEIVVGGTLIDSARGALFDGQATGGFRVTWEWSRTVFSDELFRELSFVEVTWFHAGTSERDGQLVTSGGRVFCVTTLSDNVKQAQKRAYDVIVGIHFDGMQYRRDIGHRALNR